MEMIKLENYRNSYSVAVLRDGTVIDPRNLPGPEPRGVNVVKDGFGNIIAISVPKDEVLIVYHVSVQPGSSKYYIEVIGSNVANVRVKSRVETEEVNEGYKIVKKYYDSKYAEIVLKDGRTIEAPVDRKLAKTETVMLGKPRVYMVKDGDVIEAFGDTFYLKDLFRELGFRWDTTKRRWVLRGGNIAEVVEKIKQQADVRLIGVRGSQ